MNIRIVKSNKARDELVQEFEELHKKSKDGSGALLEKLSKIFITNEGMKYEGLPSHNINNSSTEDINAALPRLRGCFK